MKYLFVCLLLTLLPSILHAQFDTIAHWGFDEPSGINTIESISGRTFIIASRGSYSERVEGIAGKGLRTDGYTTWAEGDLNVSLPRQIISVSGWIALNSYPGSVADIWSNMDPLSFAGLRLGITRFGKVECQLSINQFPVLMSTEQSLPHNKWQFVVATINTASGQACLYVNGKMVKKEMIPKGAINWPVKKQYIGRNAKDEKFLNLFPINVLNGIIDEIVLWRRELDSAFVWKIYQQQKPFKEPDMNIPSIRFAEDFHRPKYHAIPNSGWTNEPHGLVCFNKKYHFFYQKNANGPFLRNINWGHQISSDLLHWRDTAAVLWPQPGYDQLNIWSGHLVVNKSVPTIFYTGVDIGYKQTICAAYSMDSMKTFIKHPANPLISTTPSEYIFSEMRDPYVFKQGSTWYMVVGTSINTTPKKGAVILYRSPDLVKWEYLNPLFIGDPGKDETGVFWELPIFYKIGEKYLLMVNRVPLPGIPAKTFYWIGRFINDKFLPDHLIPQKLELVNWFLVPCINYDEEGRLTAIGFIADNIPLSMQYKQGWTHTFSLPRVWNLRGDSVLIQSPHPYLKRLRSNKTSFSNIRLSPEGSGFLNKNNGWQLELEAKITRDNAKQAGFIIGKSSDNKEFTRIYYDYDSGQIVIDCRMSSIDTLMRSPVVSERFLLKDTKEIDWRLYIDGSVIEVFINNESAFVMRIFPVNKESSNVDLFVKGGTARATANVWKLSLKNDQLTNTIKR